jgi:hypothetical protein
MLVQADETSTAASWTLDALTETANAMGIIIGRSQVRRILLADGARWRQACRDVIDQRPWSGFRVRGEELPDRGCGVECCRWRVHPEQSFGGGRLFPAGPLVPGALHGDQLNRASVRAGRG